MEIKLVNQVSSIGSVTRKQQADM
jgi:proteasome maturation protein